MMLTSRPGLKKVGWILWIMIFPVNAQVDVADYMLKAEQAQEKHDYRRAEMYYTRLVRAQPENIEYRIQLGEVQLLRNRLERAREQALEILARDVGNRAGLILISKISLLEKAWETAFGHLQTLQNLYPDEPYIYLGLASVYSSRDDDEAAEAAIKTYRALQTEKADNG